MDEDTTPTPDTNDQGSSDRSNRSAAIIDYIYEFIQGTIKTPKRPTVSGLSEAALLRIEAAVLDIEANSRGEILSFFATMMPNQEQLEAYRADLDADYETAAQGLTTWIFREHVGNPIFHVVAEECLEVIPHTEMPACLEAAAQFAIAHMPPDEDFIPELRNGKFKELVAKSKRRAADKALGGAKSSRSAAPKSDEEPPKAKAAFPKRAAWLRERLAERAWNRNDPSQYGGPDPKTVDKILRGEAVREDVLEKLARALSSKDKAVELLTIPRG